MSTQSQQLDDHLNGENHSEDHVEDVHDGGEQFGLLVVLRKRKVRQRQRGSGQSSDGRLKVGVPEWPESACFPESART